MQEKLASPKGQQLLRDFETRLKKAGEEKHYVPAPVATITPTLEHRSYLFNPSVSLSQDLFDHNQVRFYKAGDSVNPLDSLTLSKEYLFIDGDKPLQVEWAKRTQNHKRIAIILVKGDPMRLMYRQNIKVFFDQEGAMTSRFQLSHVPCSLAQEGKMLRITEWTEDEISEQTVAEQSSGGLVESGIESGAELVGEPGEKSVGEISPLSKDLKREGKTP
jgi:conjugal transfer pilus assembly protein TraW